MFIAVLGMVQSFAGVGGSQTNNDINTVDNSTGLTSAEIAELEALRDKIEARIAEIDAISAVLVK